MANRVILAVDDDPSVLNLIDQSARAIGVRTLRAETGEDALALLRGEKPDLVVLDAVLPGMSGEEVCRRLKNGPDTGNIPVVMIAGAADEEAVVAGFNAGADDYLPKPFGAKLLQVKIQAVLRSVGVTLQEPTENGAPNGEAEAPPSAAATPHVSIRTRTRAQKSLEDHYKILGTLGKGKDTTVYHALDQLSSPQREVALKVFVFKEDDENFLAKFLREAQQLAKMTHPNIVRLLDYGNYQDDYFIVTEYVKGQTLGKAIKEIGPIAEESAVDLALEIAQAFQYYNQFGIVHRDIKPDNIIISDEGQVVLVDFGLAREEHMGTLSLKNEMSGTPQFLSPEYINGNVRLDIRSDIYSLGITLFYAVTGRLPFQAGTPIAMIHKQLTADAPSLTQVSPVISNAFSNIVDAMLVKDPKDRCDLAEMIAAFEKMRDEKRGGGSGAPKPSHP